MWRNRWKPVILHTHTHTYTKHTHKHKPYTRRHRIYEGLGHGSLIPNICFDFHCTVVPLPITIALRTHRNGNQTKFREMQTCKMQRTSTACTWAVTKKLWKTKRQHFWVTHLWIQRLWTKVYFQRWGFQQQQSQLKAATLTQVVHQQFVGN